MSKSKGQFGFFDIDNQLAKIYQQNDFLPKLNTLIDWEMFRPILSKVREKGPGKENPNNVGRPPFDVVLMFKILVIKSIYNLADERIEEQIRDRISFRAFLGLLNFADTIPDAQCKIIWRSGCLPNNSSTLDWNVLCLTDSMQNLTLVVSPSRAA